MGQSRISAAGLPQSPPHQDLRGRREFGSALRQTRREERRKSNMAITIGMTGCSPITRAISARGSANPGEGLGVGDDDQFGLTPVISTLTRIRSSSGMVSYIRTFARLRHFSRADRLYRLDGKSRSRPVLCREEPMFRIQLPPAASHLRI
jgi:hypothetical protein